MQKKVRYYTWLLLGILGRYRKTILGSFLMAVVLAILFFRFSGPLVVRFKSDHQIIGLVGSYTPTSLPLFLQRLISSGLTDIDESGEVVPALATSWTVSPDGKVYTFTLRDDLYWHDKTKFTAHDLNYNLRDVEFVPTKDTEMVIKLRDAFSPLPSFLSKPLFKQGLVGLGSYRISGIRLKGDTVMYLKLTPLPPDLPNIEVKFYPTESLAKIAFQLGEVNVLDEISDPAPFTEANPHVFIKPVVNFQRYVGIFFNLNDPLLKEKDIRQALIYVLEKPEKNRVATPLSSKSWAYTNQVKQYDQDIDMAQKLIGALSSDSARLTLSTNTHLLDTAQKIADSWNAVGVTTEVKVESGLPENYQALLVIQEIPLDPDQYPLWHSTQTQTNIAHYANPKIDKLLEDGRKERDQEKREKIYFDFQRYLVDDAPAAFLYHSTTYTISRK